MVAAVSMPFLCAISCRTAPDRRSSGIYKICLRRAGTLDRASRLKASRNHNDVIAMEQFLTKAAVDVLAERQRQIKAEGFTPEHDDLHTEGQLARAAAAYAVAADSAIYEADKLRPAWNESYIAGVSRVWPWNWTLWKPTNKRRDLVKAAALLLAEIERVDRTLSGQVSRG